MDVPVLGLTCKDKARAGQLFVGVKILGSDEVLGEFSKSDVGLVNGVGSSGENHSLRRKIFAQFKTEGFSFFSTLYPAVDIEEGVSLGEGCQVQKAAVIQVGVAIGVNSIINTGSIVEHDCVIGDHCHVASGALLCGAVRLGPGSFVGAGSVLRQGVQVGEGCVIGAGSLVISDLPAHSLCYGQPAKAIRKL